MPGFCLYVVPGTERRSSCLQNKQYTDWLPQAITLVFLNRAAFLVQSSGWLQNFDRCLALVITKQTSQTLQQEKGFFCEEVGSGERMEI